MKSLILVLSLFLSVNSFANNWYDRGNGGVILTCQGSAPQVLDLYEAQTRFNLTVVPTKAQGDEMQIAAELIGRLADKDPSRANLYSAWLKTFMTDAQFVTGSFAKTPDLGSVVIPDGCDLQQAVVQQQPSVVNAYRYLVNKNLWSQLDANNKAALILHEIIYREMITTPSQEFSSERIRYFNDLIHANLPGVSSLENYISTLQSVHLSSYTYKGWALLLGNPDGTGEWNSASVIFDSQDRITAASLLAFQTINQPYMQYTCANKSANPLLGAASFNEKGQLVTLNVDDNFKPTLDCNLPLFSYDKNGSAFSVSGKNWKFESNGTVSEVSGGSLPALSQVTYLKNTFVSPNSLSLYASGDASTFYSFDKDMNLTGIGLGGSPCVNAKDKKIYFNPGTSTLDLTVSLNSKGSIVGSLPACY